MKLFADRMRMQQMSMAMCQEKVLSFLKCVRCAGVKRWRAGTLSDASRSFCGQMVMMCSPGKQLLVLGENNEHWVSFAINCTCENVHTQNSHNILNLYAWLVNQTHYSSFQDLRWLLSSPSIFWVQVFYLIYVTVLRSISMPCKHWSDADQCVSVTFILGLGLNWTYLK